MITQETIKKQANEFADNFDSDSPTFGNIKRRVAYFSFRSGANFAIQQMETDMKKFAEWTQREEYFFDINYDLWYRMTERKDIDDNNATYTTDKLFKRWMMSNK